MTEAHDEAHPTRAEIEAMSDAEFYQWRSDATGVPVEEMGPRPTPEEFARLLSRTAEEWAEAMEPRERREQAVFDAMEAAGTLKHYRPGIDAAILVGLQHHGDLLRILAAKPPVPAGLTEQEEFAWHEGFKRGRRLLIDYLEVTGPTLKNWLASHEPNEHDAFRVAALAQNLDAALASRVPLDLGGGTRRRRKSEH